MKRTSRSRRATLLLITTALLLGASTEAVRGQVAGESAPPPVTVTLPTATFDNSVPISTVIVVPVATTFIDPSLNYVFFQGDFTFDSAVVTFSSPIVETIGTLTATNWNVSAGILNSGPGTIKTLRLSAYSQDQTPLNGSGTLFKLRMLRVSSTPGTTSPLVWKPAPDNLIFVDTDFNTHEPASTPSGLITITGTGPTATPTATPPTPPPTPTPTPTPTATPSSPTPTPLPVTVTLPTATFDNSVPMATVIIVPVVTTFIDPSLDYVFFQGDFTFDSSVVTFDTTSGPVQPAGLTATQWNVSAGILNSGPGTIKTLRISAVSQDQTPLNGSGTLFNLRMRRVSSTPAATSPLVWKPAPDNLIFIDNDLNTHEPASTPSGLITITGTGPSATPTPVSTPTATPPTPTPASTPSATPSPPTPTPPPITVTLPTATFDNSVPMATVIIVPVVTTFIDPSLNYIFFQGDFTFDSSVVTFDTVSGPTQPAGVTATTWNVSAAILNSGPGAIKTLRISAFSQEQTPLNGSGPLFNLRMLRLSSTPGATSPLVWKPAPDNLIFGDTDFNTHAPASTPSGLITIGGPVTISGTVSYCSNPVPGPVAGVTLTLTGSASASTVSDGSGNYSFSGLPAGGSYTVTLTKANRAPGSMGINTLDAIAVQKHFLGSEVLPSGCRLTAANLNGDAAVDTRDVNAIQRFFLGRTSGIGQTGQYQLNPTSRTYPGVISNQTGQNYDALILGDVAPPFAQ